MAPFVGLLGASDSKIAAEAMERLVGHYSSVTTEDILDKKSLLEFGKDPNCLYRSTPLRAKVNEALRPALFEWLRREDMPFCYVVYTNFQTGALEVVSPRDPGMSRDRFIDALMASSSVPGIMEPTIIDGQHCYDGGVRDLIPFTRAIALGAETIVPIMLHKGGVSPVASSFRRLDQVLPRTLAIMRDEAAKNDLRLATLINQAIRARRDVLKALTDNPQLCSKVRAVFEQDEYRDLFGAEKHLARLIEGLHPDEQLTDNSLHFDPAKMREWIKLGEQKAESVLRESPFRREPADLSMASLAGDSGEMVHSRSKENHGI